jgi:lipopolysaccharide/colanic/teichoic acid biosynthesis glycosyltransferase
MNVHRISAIRKASVNQRVIANNGFAQLLGGLVVAVGLPFIAFAGTDFAAAETVQKDVFYASLAAVLVGHYFFRRFVFFPGARSSSYVVPIFTATYAVALTTFFFFRIDYSRLAFASSFLLCESWYFVCHVMGARARPRRLAVIPVGKARKVNRIPNIDWIWLRDSEAALPECDGIVADLRADLSDEWERFIAERAIGGVPVYHVKQIEESVTGRVDIEHLSENSFGSLVPGLGYIKIKQLIDLVAAMALGLLLLPALLLVALLVRFDSPGPALFKQRRVGYRGVPITVYKFRTMRYDPVVRTERDSAITQDGDARITRLGRYLRHSRIDELPQIINILRGEMSWIGPRPEACTLSEWYESEIPFYRYRHIVHPGITGWAQVNQGHVAGVADVLDKLQFDFYYIKYFSPWLDMLIVLRTIRTMLTGFGSK